MIRHLQDIQGRFPGLPYDWRRPTADKVRSRIWNPNAPMFTPKVFGCGYTLNLRHRGSWALIVAVAMLGSVAACLL